MPQLEFIKHHCSFLGECKCKWDDLCEVKYCKNQQEKLISNDEYNCQNENYRSICNSHYQNLNLKCNCCKVETELHKLKLVACWLEKNIYVEQRICYNCRVVECQKNLKCQRVVGVE